MSTSMLNVSPATLNTDAVKKVVQDRYGKCAEQGGGESFCCAGEASSSSSSFAAEHGLYSRAELSLVPQTAITLSRGCGSPTGFADLHSGETVVDFGCGAGIDVFLAARKVGGRGKVVGVDFASHMIERAKHMTVEAGLMETTEFLVNGVRDFQFSPCIDCGGCESAVSTSSKSTIWDGWNFPTASPTW